MKGLSVLRVQSFHRRTSQLLCFPASVKYWRPSSVKLLSLRYNNSSLQLLCLSAAAKSSAALSVNLLQARYNIFSFNYCA